MPMPSILYSTRQAALLCKHCTVPPAGCSAPPPPSCDSGFCQHASPRPPSSCHCSLWPCMLNGMPNHQPSEQLCMPIDVCNNILTIVSHSGKKSKQWQLRNISQMRWRDHKTGLKHAQPCALRPTMVCMIPAAPCRMPAPPSLLHPPRPYSSFLPAPPSPPARCTGVEPYGNSLPTRPPSSLSSPSNKGPWGAMGTNRPLPGSTLSLPSSHTTRPLLMVTVTFPCTRLPAGGGVRQGCVQAAC
jgi:hypothetical protein